MITIDLPHKRINSIQPTGLKGSFISLHKEKIEPKNNLSRHSEAVCRNKKSRSLVQMNSRSGTYLDKPVSGLNVNLMKELDELGNKPVREEILKLIGIHKDVEFLKGDYENLKRYT
jgi:hypothetical protein